MIRVIIDCQFGSTGKGLFAGYLSQKFDPDVLCMAPSPNAGHTLVLDDGTSIVHKMLPLGILSKRLRAIYLGPGSLIDPDRLQEEVQALCTRSTVAVYVARNAGVVLQRHRDAEQHGGTAPGSTRSGAGAALADRVRRSPESVVFGNLDHPVRELVEVISTVEAQALLDCAHEVQVEGCQGYGLSIHHGHYPHVTSRDVTTVQLLADCGIPFPRSMCLVYGTFRTYPIRVANRPEAGEWSGPTYPDSEEVTFESLGMPQEYTTVTKLPRRIFTWSNQLAAEACAQNRVDQCFLNFSQYPPTFDELQRIRASLEQQAPTVYFGFGPRPSDIYRCADPAAGGDIRLRELWERYRQPAPG
jgi:adenylosuccinate synthase